MLTRMPHCFVLAFCMAYRSSVSDRPELPAFVKDPVRCLKERGFAFAPEFGKAFAREYNMLMGGDIAVRRRQVIAGDVLQYAMPKTGDSPWPLKLRAAWHKLVLELAVFAGHDPATLQLYHVQDEKLLIAGRLKGEQGPHFDRDDTAEKLRKVFTVILYLTDDADSTAFPEFKQDEFALPEFAEDETTVLNAEELAQSVERGCLEKERYVRWKVRVGDMALFTQACMHFGTQCTTLHERQALFSVLTPYEGARQDDYQVRSGRKHRMSREHGICLVTYVLLVCIRLYGLSCCRFIGQSCGDVEAKRVDTVAMRALLSATLSPSLSLAFAQLDVCGFCLRRPIARAGGSSVA